MCNVLAEIPMQSLPAQCFTEISHERVEIDILYWNLHFSITILATAAFCLSNMYPVSRSVAGTTKTCRVNEGFNKRNRMPIATLPVMVKLFQVLLPG